MVAPTAREQYIIELVNRARADPSGEAARYGIGLNDDLAAGTITSAPKQPLAVSPLLVDSSLAHSLSMITHDYFSHTGNDYPSYTGTDLTSPSDRIFRAGWTHENQGWRTGENISYRASSDPARVQTVETLDKHHEGLFKSSGHRKNILNGEFSEFGLGIEIGPFNNFTASMLTQNFADAGRTFLTGVAIDDGDGDDFYDVGEGLGGITVTATGSAGTYTTQTWAAGGYSLEVDPGTYQVTFSGGGFGSGYSVGAYSVSNENVKVDANLDDYSPVTIDVTDLSTGDPAVIFGQLRDYDGNDLGSAGGWKQLGIADVQNDGDDEYVYVNPTIGRWATLGPDATDTIDFRDHGQGGDTRVVGIYIDPLVQSGIVQQGSPHDSQQRFQNDLNIDNLKLLKNSDDDFDGDGFQEIYFKTVDGTAYLRALMHADGNIQYANYQSEQQMTDYLAANGYDQTLWGDWLTA